MGRAEHGFGNVTIEQDWEVTLDENVDFINKLNISGVLKFEDKPGCCKLVARYIFVGPNFGRLEAGTSDNPIKTGTAHIVLKGHPMTPNLKTFRPHLVGSAKWMRNKFIAVQGALSLYGEARAKTWVKVAVSSNVGAKELTVEEGHSFKVGDVVTIHRGFETRKITGVAGPKITFDQALVFAYKGKDHKHMNREETQGMMATAVGLIDGHRVVVEGEDTPGVPMCNKDENRTCPYSKGFPGGMNLHDFAKEMRHYLERQVRQLTPIAALALPFRSRIIQVTSLPCHISMPGTDGAPRITAPSRHAVLSSSMHLPSIFTIATMEMLHSLTDYHTLLPTVGTIWAGTIHGAVTQCGRS
jgi:hypothetical protein